MNWKYRASSLEASLVGHQPGPGIGPGLVAIIFFLEHSELEGEIVPRTFRVL